MKTLYESIFDVDDNIANMDIPIKDRILTFILENYELNYDIIISDSPNKNGKYVVYCPGNVIVRPNRRALKSLTNKLFVWGIVNGRFDCSNCHSLTSLEGAPEEVGRDFYCDGCTSLTSLKGAPKKVGRDFYCSYCSLLISLKGAPKKVGGNFICHDCKILFTEEDVKKNSKINGYIKP